MRETIRDFLALTGFIVVSIMFYNVFVEPKISGGGVVYPAVQPSPAALVVPTDQSAARSFPQVVIIPTVPPTPVPVETPIYVTTCQETIVYGVPVEVNYAVVWSIPSNYPILLEKYNEDMTWAMLSPMTTGRQEEMWITTRSITVCP